MNNQSDNLDVAAEYRLACARISRDDCAECGDEIPEGRRAAVPGVQCCRDCQSISDLRVKGVRRV